MVPKSPRKAIAHRQPRQSSGAARPVIKLRILEPPATPPTGARGINVGPRLIRRKFNYMIGYFFLLFNFKYKLTLDID
jgi:hypothetical protein